VAGFCGAFGESDDGYVFVFCQDLFDVWLGHVCCLLWFCVLGAVDRPSYLGPNRGWCWLSVGNVFIFFVGVLFGWAAVAKPGQKAVFWLEAKDSRSFPVGVRRFESGPPHQRFLLKKFFNANPEIFTTYLRNLKSRKMRKKCLKKGL